MKRREFIKLISLAGLSISTPILSKNAKAIEPYTGNFYVFIDVRGGWDVTSFCDPKQNIFGEHEINNWARTLDIRQAGQIPYAPIANNKRFFERFYPHMLIINGVDAQTNSHDAGVLHNWTGRLNAGLPSLAALTAAVYGPEQPISFISNGGCRETAGIIRYTQLNNTTHLQTLLNPNQHLPHNDHITYHRQDTLDRINHFKQQRLKQLMSGNGHLPRQLKAMNHLYLAESGLEELKQFSHQLPDNLISDYDANGLYRPLPRQIQLALTAYNAGLCVSCDLHPGSDFDTHSNHDNKQVPALTELTDGIEYLFDLAGDMGISNKLFVVIGSDFGRAPFYNSENGKDHWPIGSFIIMKENARWGNQVIGKTDDAYNAIPINPSTLAEDTTGTLIYPKHIHDAIRREIGINNSAHSKRFNLRTSEHFNIFG